MFGRRNKAVDPEEDPRPYLLWLLARRDYSRAQLETKLRARGHAPQRIREVLDALVDEGLLRENAFASARIRALIHRGYGPALIRAKLRQERTQFSEDDILRAYEDLGTSSEAQVGELVRKALKFSSRMRGELDLAGRRRIVQAVSSKGHAISLVLSEIERQIRD